MEKHSVDFQLLTKSLNSSKKFPLIGCIRKSPYSKTIHFAPRHDWRGDAAHWCSLPCDWCPALNPFFKIRKALVFRNPSQSWPEHSLIVNNLLRKEPDLFTGRHILHEERRCRFLSYWPSHFLLRMCQSLSIQAPKFSDQSHNHGAEWNGARRAEWNLNKVKMSNFEKKIDVSHRNHAETSHSRNAHSYSGVKIIRESFVRSRYPQYFHSGWDDSGLGFLQL